jgi:aspartyl/asparaginyl beta-hydroxylase (cupin superfamily)
VKKQIENLEFYDEKVLFLVCDIWVPKENKFVCNVNKLENGNTIFSTGIQVN